MPCVGCCEPSSLFGSAATGRRAMTAKAWVSAMVYKVRRINTTSGKGEAEAASKGYAGNGLSLYTRASAHGHDEIYLRTRHAYTPPKDKADLIREYEADTRRLRGQMVGKSGDALAKLELSLKIKERRLTELKIERARS